VHAPLSFCVKRSWVWSHFTRLVGSAQYGID
jgi:hypothetical protein